MAASARGALLLGEDTHPQDIGYVGLAPRGLPIEAGTPDAEGPEDAAGHGRHHLSRPIQSRRIRDLILSSSC